MKINSFQDLIVWQKAMELSKQTYYITAKFPREEQYGLSSQMRRSAVSIPSNIAEGTKRGTRKDYVQFVRVASGSAAELETQILIAKDIYPHTDFTSLMLLLKEIQKMLEVLVKKLGTVH